MAASNESGSASWDWCPHSKPNVPALQRSPDGEAKKLPRSIIVESCWRCCRWAPSLESTCAQDEAGSDIKVQLGSNRWNGNRRRSCSTAIAAVADSSLRQALDQWEAGGAERHIRAGCPEHEQGSTTAAKQNGADGPSARPTAGTKQKAILIAFYYANYISKMFSL